MKFLFFFSIYLWIGFVSFGQKKPIDYSTPDFWPELTKEAICNNGKYLSYVQSSPATGSVLVIRSTDRSWERMFSSAGSAAFTADSRFFVFMRGNDSLGILNIAGDSVVYKGHVSSFTLPGESAAGWLTYRTDDAERKGLVLLNLASGQDTLFSQVNDFGFAPGQALLAVETGGGLNSSKPISLVLLDLSMGMRSVIWTGSHPCRFVFSPSGLQLALKTDIVDREGHMSGVIEYFEIARNKEVVLVSQSTPGMEGRMLSEGTVNDISFSRDGKNLFFYTKKTTYKSTDISHQHVHIWNAQDIVLGDQYHSNGSLKSRSAAVINLSLPNRVVILENDIADFFDHSRKFYNNNRVLVYTNHIGMPNEYKWRPSARMGICLISTLDGSEKMIAENLINTYVAFSTDGKYVIYYDRKLKSWFTYNIRDDVSRNISSKVKFTLNTDIDYPDAQFADAQGIVGWLAKDLGVLVYDRFDIWQLDPLGHQQPVNLTRGYGRKNHVCLRSLDFNGKYDFPLQNKDTLLLAALNLGTKSNGFFKLVLGAQDTLIKLPQYAKAIYYVPRFSAEFSDASEPFIPLKAKNADTYVCKIMTASEYPNIYTTHDFNHFIPLTSLEPQKDIKWFSNEMVQWQLPGGGLGEGILYKPEDFDIHKKYPVLFYIYDKFSDALYTFLNPKLSNGVLNIPWYLSHDYLVFVPDIQFQVGHPGESAYRTVESAAKYLSHYAWVNSHAMGMQGHSFGAWEVNYIVTRTKTFAAVASVDGVTDLISDAGRAELGTSAHLYYEEGQGRIGASIWEQPSLYTENSPVFHADRVSTPILIAHNKGDNTVIFSQGMEWFTALRRLGKPAWFLQYDEPNHTIADPFDQLDYSIKLSEFFDHFLKGTPAPEWISAHAVSGR